MRLKQALKLAKAPRTHVDTQAVADKAIALLDMVLEVCTALLPGFPLLPCRNLQC